MSESSSVDALAKRFLDLWEEQAAAMAADQTLAEGLRQAVEAALGAGASRSPQASGPRDDASPPDRATTASADVAAGAEAAGAASGDRARHLDELARRLAECQSRLDALASEPGGERGGAGGGAGKREP